ncbi:hypothetical protein Q8F55_001561 [Vanrija albida]|uniref:Uncharacterized protein n=1 Tax=Vanrija albida TaxID=181172 RepID=A0ABR3QGC0_9TREE
MGADTSKPVQNNYDSTAAQLSHAFSRYAQRPPESPGVVSDVVGLLRLLVRDPDFKSCFTPTGSALGYALFKIPGILSGIDRPLQLVRDQGIITDKPELDTIPLIIGRLLKSIDDSGSGFRFEGLMRITVVCRIECIGGGCPPIEAPLPNRYVVELPTAPYPDASSVHDTPEEYSVKAQLDLALALEGVDNIASTPRPDFPSPLPDSPDSPGECSCKGQYTTQTILKGSRGGLVILHFPKATHPVILNETIQLPDRSEPELWILASAVVRHGPEYGGYGTVLQRKRGGEGWVHVVEGEVRDVDLGASGGVQGLGLYAGDRAEVAFAVYRCVPAGEFEDGGVGLGLGGGGGGGGGAGGSGASTPRQ